MADRPTHYPATNSVGAAPSGGFRPSHRGERRGGRQKGTPNKSTTTLKDAILRAAELAGDELKTSENGLVAYLKHQATASPASFLPLLGKILPKEVGADMTVRHTLEDYVMASFKVRETREARASQGNTLQAHAASSAPQIEQRAEFNPPPAVIDGRPPVRVESRVEDRVGLIPAQPGLSLQALVLGSMPLRDHLPQTRQQNFKEEINSDGDESEANR